MFCDPDQARIRAEILDKEQHDRMMAEKQIQAPEERGREDEEVIEVIGQ